MRDLEPIGEDVEAVLRRLGIPAGASLARLVDEWATLAGDPWAGAGKPVGLEKGVLVVEVASGAHASLLRYQVGALVDRLRERVGDGVVSSVRLRVGSSKKAL